MDILSETLERKADQEQVESLAAELQRMGVDLNNALGKKERTTKAQIDGVQQQLQQTESDLMARLNQKAEAKSVDAMSQRLGQLSQRVESNSDTTAKALQSLR